jgi:hypothetical protein
VTTQRMQYGEKIGHLYTELFSVTLSILANSEPDRLPDCRGQS